MGPSYTTWYFPPIIFYQYPYVPMLNLVPRVNAVDKNALADVGAGCMDRLFKDA